MSDAPDGPSIDYPALVREALRGVVRQALALAAAEGLPGDHHYFLEIETQAPGVAVPPFLRDLHPERLTLLIQYQYWDLVADDDRFSVTLAFGGERHRLTVPYAAVTAFADPSVGFGLRFDAPAAAEGEAGEGGEPATADRGEPESGAGGSESAGEATVIRTDRFRKPEGD